MDHSALVAAYWTYYRLAWSGDSADRAEGWWWAWDEVTEAVSEHRPDLIELLTQLAEAVGGDEAALAYLGAGPFESLLREGDPVDALQFLDGLEAAARRSPAVRVALSHVWSDEKDDWEVLSFLRRVRQMDRNVER
jgi:hypothetical protein